MRPLKALITVGIGIALSISSLLIYGCVKKVPGPSDLARVGVPLEGLSPEELQRFDTGKKAFQRIFFPEEGLGPLFNAEGCGVCHTQPVTGGSSAIAEVHASKFQPPDACDPLFQEGGPVIQQRATPLLRATGIEKEEIPPSATGQALRTSPPVFGLGLVDAIPEETILENEDPNDADGDGISGRANRFIDGRLGRFGRKAFIPTLFEFNAGAFTIEQSVTNPLQPVEETINGQPVPPETDPVPEPEIPLSEIEAVNDFVRFLAPPSQRDPASCSEEWCVKRGGKIFEKIGCASCHVPSMQTGPSDIPALNNQTVFLYSDLLVHDMGPDLADICLGLATPPEFRTEMLMGLRFRRQFLHDGSAKTVREAIEGHGGEAERSREAFEKLRERDKASLLQFLDTI